MRLVKRRFTRKRRGPKPPWEFRPEWWEGAPRVCLSNYHWPVLDGNKELGSIDRMLHLYQHRGLRSRAEIDGSWHILYRFGIEWPVVKEHAFWIEFVDDSQEATARISRDDALRFGHKTTHAGESVWAVPFNRYTINRRNI